MFFQLYILFSISKRKWHWNFVNMQLHSGSLIQVKKQVIRMVSHYYWIWSFCIDMSKNSSTLRQNVFLSGHLVSEAWGKPCSQQPSILGKFQACGQLGAHFMRLHPGICVRSGFYEWSLLWTFWTFTDGQISICKQGYMHCLELMHGALSLWH